MNSKESLAAKTVKYGAAVGGALTATFVPQHCDADIVTVGGDGGTGTVTLSRSNTRTDLGGVLLENRPIIYNLYSGPFGRNAQFLIPYGGFASNAVRSSVADPGNDTALNSNFRFSSGGNPNDNAVFESDDNWIAGRFRVNGVNGGNEIFGWLQVDIGGVAFGSFNPTIVSFTYDDEATSLRAFEKPIGGFTVGATTAVPEPSGFAFLALLAAGAGGIRRYRQAA